MTETLEELLIRHERKVRHAYQDSLGYWTIGVGRLIDKRKGGGLSNAEIHYLLRNDIASKSDQVRLAFSGWWRRLSIARQNVLICMCFQLGIAGLLKFKATLAAMESGDYAAAAKGMLASRWAKQTPERVRELAAMMRSG